MVLTLVPAIRKPCTTSGLVARKTTGAPAGTTMHCGTNEYCCAITRTTTEPSACDRGAEVGLHEFAGQVQRLASTVSTFDGGAARASARCCR